MNMHHLKERKIKVDYINLDELDNLKYKFLKGLDNIGHFELNDYLLESRLKKYGMISVMSGI